MTLVRRAAGLGGAFLPCLALASCGLDVAGNQPSVGDAALPRDATTHASTDASGAMDAELCGDGATSCSDRCVLTSSDPSHCGGCDTTCRGGDASCSASVCTATLRVRGFIDATSQLVLQGGALHWFNGSSGAAPGLWQGPPNQPTYLDSVPWSPAWPNGGENRSRNCSSSSAPITPLAARSQAITLTIIEGRGTVAVVQQPTAANGYAATLELSDPQSGASWYELLLGYATN